jgi:multidrug efflux pump subunit AcrA (membrane-fusion protein)
VIRRFSDKWFLATASVLLLALISGAALLYQRSRTPPAAPPTASAEPVLPPGSEISFTGLVQARQVVLVPPPMDGTLESVEVEVGQEVFEGQLLARIKNPALESSRDAAREDRERAQSRVNNLESSLIAARLESSRAAADASRAKLEFEKAEKLALRQQMLMREGATARLVHDKAQKDYQMASADYQALRDTERQAQNRVDSLVRDLEAARRALEEKNNQLEAATADLEGAEVVSPVDGILIAARGNPGDEITLAMEDLFQIAIDPGRLQVNIDPDPPARNRLSDGLPALVQVLEISSDALSGELKIGEDGKVRVEFTTTDPYLKPGLNAIVKIKLP